MFHIYFLGSSEGLVFDVADANFDAALDPLRGYLGGHGVDFRTRHHVTAVETGGEFLSCCTVDAGAALRRRRRGAGHSTSRAAAHRRCAPRSSATPAGATEVARLRTAPPFVVHRLWLDRPVAADRPAFLGTGGLTPLDNVSVLERYEREAADWARRTRGSVVELHSYAVHRPPTST